MLIILAVIVLAALYAVLVYNGLVRARQVAEEAWSGIDVQLKRRADLIPNLVETVKGYAGHENQTLREVIQARNSVQAVPAGDIAGRAAVFAPHLGREEADVQDVQLVGEEMVLESIRKHHDGVIGDRSGDEYVHEG